MAGGRRRGEDTPSQSRPQEYLLGGGQATCRGSHRSRYRSEPRAVVRAGGAGRQRGAGEEGREEEQKQEIHIRSHWFGNKRYTQTHNQTKAATVGTDYNVTRTMWW